MFIVASQSKTFKDSLTYQTADTDAWFDKDNYKVAITTAAKAGTFDGRGSSCKLGHRFLTVLGHKVTCKHYSVISFKWK